MEELQSQSLQKYFLVYGILYPKVTVLPQKGRKARESFSEVADRVMQWGKESWVQFLTLPFIFII